MLLKGSPTITLSKELIEIHPSMVLIQELGESLTFPFQWIPDTNVLIRGFFDTPEEQVDTSGSYLLTIQCELRTFSFEWIILSRDSTDFTNILGPATEKNLRSLKSMCKFCGMDHIKNLNPSHKAPYIIVCAGDDQRIFPLGHTW